MLGLHVRAAALLAAWRAVGSGVLGTQWRRGADHSTHFQNDILKGMYT